MGQANHQWFVGLPNIPHTTHTHTQDSIFIHACLRVWLAHNSAAHILKHEYGTYFE